MTEETFFAYRLKIMFVSLVIQHLFIPNDILHNGSIRQKCKISHFESEYNDTYECVNLFYSSCAYTLLFSAILLCKTATALKPTSF